MAAQTRGGGGVSLCTVLVAIFVTLKLCGVIEWSWLWVLSPLWLPLSLFAAFMAFCLAMAVFTGQIGARFRR
jgi:hypothetical protein